MSYPFTFLIEHIQPEPWEAAQASTGRRKGKLFVQHYSPEAMVQYKDALAKEFIQQYGKPCEDPNFPPVNRIQFYFWREVVRYETPTGKIQTGNVADATNLQKSTEDALQGILYPNDRTNFHVSSAIVAQAFGVLPGIMIVADHVEDINAELAWANAARVSMGGGQNFSWSAAGNFIKRDEDDVF